MKLISAVLAIITIILIPAQNYLHFALLVLWLIIIIHKSHKSIGFYMMRIAAIYPMIFFMTFLLPFTKSDTAVNTDILFSIGSINIYQYGINMFLDINIRSILIFTCSLVTIHETSLDSTLKVLSTMRIPKWIEAIIIYMQRFIHLIGSEFNRIHMAFTARAFNMNFFGRIKATGKLSLVYFTRLLERSERSHMAMLSKGFNGTIYTRYNLNWRKADTGTLIFNCAFLSLFLFGWVY